MAKKFVRGITDVKNIKKQDFDTNNVNDLLSDGEHNYIHRKKKDGTQEYHNLTDNIKTIEKVDNGLLEVTNYNKTKNSATLKVNHDSQKEQKLYSADHTIDIVHGDNGSGEFTNVDVDPSKVMLTDNLVCDYGLKSVSNNEGVTTLTLEPRRVTYPFDVNTPFKGKVIGETLPNSPAPGWFMYENDYIVIGGNNYIIQKAIRLKLVNVAYNEVYYRTLDSNTWSPWVKQVTDVTLLESMVTEIVNNILGTNTPQTPSVQTPSVQTPSVETPSVATEKE